MALSARTFSIQIHFLQLTDINYPHCGCAIARVCCELVRKWRHQNVTSAVWEFLEEPVVVQGMERTERHRRKLPVSFVSFVT